MKHDIKCKVIKTQSIKFDYCLIKIKKISI